MVSKTEDCAVAFVDVLGFRALVSRAHANDEDASALVAVMELLEGVVPALDAKVDRSVVTAPMIPQCAQFSDSIVLLAPLRVNGRPYYNGLEIVAMRCIQVAHIALDHGYLVRGGIDIGPIFRVGANIAGRAYMNAVATEKAAKNPRIVLCEDADRWWTSNDWGSDRMRVRFDGQSMINVLHPAYTPDESASAGAVVPMASLESQYKRYLDITTAQARNKALDCKARRKWKWMVKYVEFVARTESFRLTS